jgi:hypothetical protein
MQRLQSLRQSMQGLCQSVRRLRWRGDWGMRRLWWRVRLPAMVAAPRSVGLCLLAANQKGTAVR